MIQNSIFFQNWKKNNFCKFPPSNFIVLIWNTFFHAIICSSLLFLKIYFLTRRTKPNLTLGFDRISFKVKYCNQITIKNVEVWSKNQQPNCTVVSFISSFEKFTMLPNVKCWMLMCQKNNKFCFEALCNYNFTTIFQFQVTCGNNAGIEELIGKWTFVYF